MKRKFDMAMLGVVLAVLTAVSGCGPSTAEECLDRSMLSASAGEWKSALRLASRAVKLAPDNVEALILEAIAAEKCGKREVALKSASQAVELAPGSFAAQYTLGRLCADDPARRGEAMKALLAALKLRNGDRDTLILLCNLCDRDGSSALEGFLNMLKRDPEYAGNPVLYNQLGVACLRRKDLANARAAFAAAWKCGRNDPAVVYNVACFFDRYTTSAKATAQLYRRYLELSAGDREAAQTRALVAERLKVLGGTGR